LRKLGVKAPYVLAVGTLEPRKRQDLVLDGYLRHRAEYAASHSLVHVGRSGWKSKDVEIRFREAARQHPVHMLGGAPDPLLRDLYAGADALIFPSLYEGFGLPLVEAKVCGSARMISADTPELREAAGPSATYLEPSTATIAEAIADAPRHLPRPVEPTSWDRAGAFVAALSMASSAGT
jgi:glycosyltransferase involved in cell wall biosynthesis